MTPPPSAQAPVNIESLFANSKDPDPAGSVEIADKIEALARGIKFIFHEAAAECRHDQSLSDQQPAPLLAQLEKPLFFRPHEILQNCAADHLCPTAQPLARSPNN